MVLTQNYRIIEWRWNAEWEQPNVPPPCQTVQRITLTVKLTLLTIITLSERLADNFHETTSQRCRRKIEPGPWTRCTEIWWSFRVMRAVRQTDKQTYSSQYCAPGGQEITLTTYSDIACLSSVLTRNMYSRVDMQYHAWRRSSSPPLRFTRIGANVKVLLTLSRWPLTAIS